MQTDDATLAMQVTQAVISGNEDALLNFLLNTRFCDFHSAMPIYAQNLTETCVYLCMENAESSNLKHHVECLKLLMFHPQFCTRLCGAYLEGFLSHLSTAASAAPLRNVLSHWRPLLELSNVRCTSPACTHRTATAGQVRHQDLAYFVPRWTTFAHMLYPKPFRHVVRTLLLVARRNQWADVTVATQIVEFVSPTLCTRVAPRASLGSIDTSPITLAQYGVCGLRCRDRVEVLCRETKCVIDTGVVTGVIDGRLFWLPDSLQGTVPVHAELGTPQFVRTKLCIRPESTTTLYTPPRGTSMTPTKEPSSQSPSQSASPVSESGITVTPTSSASPSRQLTLAHYLAQRYGSQLTDRNVVEALTFISSHEGNLLFRCSVRDGKQEVRPFDVAGATTKRYGVYFGQRIERQFGDSTQVGTILGVGADGALWWVRDGDVGCCRLALAPEHMDLYVKPKIIGAAILREQEA